MARRRPVAIGRHLWGIAASLVTGLAGAWLMVAPFAIGYQNGGSWTDATKNDFWTGLAVVILSVIGIVLFSLSVVGELRAAGVLKPRQQPVPPMPAWAGQPAAAAPQPAMPAAGSPYHDELERTMALLATTLAAELAERRQARASSNSQQPVTTQTGGQQA
jgi:hypothetical protein